MWSRRPAYTFTTVHFIILSRKAAKQVMYQIKIHPSLTTSKEGLKRLNIHMGTTIIKLRHWLSIYMKVKAPLMRAGDDPRTGNATPG
jgi:hypothetical protein